MISITRSLDTDQYEDIPQWRTDSMNGWVTVYDDHEMVGKVQTATIYLDNDKKLSTTPTPISVLVVMPYTATDLALVDPIINFVRTLEMETMLAVHGNNALVEKSTTWKRFYSEGPVASVPTIHRNNEDGSTAPEILLLHNRVIIKTPLASVIGKHFS